MTESEKIEQEKNLSKDKNELIEKKGNKPDLEKEETVEEKLKTVKEKLLRSMAEMENQRRRFEKEKKEAFEFGGFNFAAESLSLLDNIDRAISIFKKNGIEPIECINKKFDPNIHQAMLEVENNTKEPGTVIQEIQKGYMMKDRLLRPSFVGVTKKVEKTAKNEKKNEKKDEKK